MDLKAVEKVVASIQTNLFKNSNSYSIGMLKSHFRGTGLKFKEHQVYVHGDDVRFIDWKLYAKTNTPYIKTFEEDRNVEIVVVIDIGLSMFQGADNISKLQAAIEICSLIALLAKATGDSVHVLLVGEKIVNIPASSGRKTIVRLVNTLEKLGVLKEDGKIDLTYRPECFVSEDQKLKAIWSHLAKRREVVLLSDFFEFLPIYGIKKIAYKNNLHCFKLESPLDFQTNIPYTIFGFSVDEIDRHKMTTKKLGVGIDEALELALGSKLKKLKIEERYLEKFIKEMV